MADVPSQLRCRCERCLTGNGGRTLRRHEDPSVLKKNFQHLPRSVIQYFAEAGDLIDADPHYGRLTSSSTAGGGIFAAE